MLILQRLKNNFVMKLLKLRYYILMFCLFYHYLDIFSQSSWYNKRLYDIYNSGKDFTSNNLFSYSYFTFLSYDRMQKDLHSIFSAHSDFMKAYVTYQLLNNDASYHLFKFIEIFPHNGYVKNAMFYLANIEFRNKRYNKSFEIYKKIDTYHLSKDEQTEFYYKYGYSSFMMEDYSSARLLFNKVLNDPDNIYASAAKYYLGHIAYIEQNYSVALKYFSDLKDDKNFVNVIPYYVAQIYYFQDKYEELISYVQPLVEQAVVSRLAEITLLLAESYFALKDYNQALKYYQLYLDKSRIASIDATTNYKIGYCYYHAGKYDQAIQFLQRSIGINDTLSQNAHYHIGYCYIKTGNKKFARTAFYEAYKIGKNPIITEDALFHFAKLSYELDMNPYNEAIKALLDYIASYPNSHRVNEAYDLLINLYFQTRNYREALVSIEKIPKPNEKFLQAYQQLTFYHGIELYVNNKFSEAIDAFKKSLKYPYERIYYAESMFWIAESYYRLNLIDSALHWNLQFHKNPFSARTKIYVRSFYNLGYCYFHQKQYDKALTQFRQFIERYKEKDEILQDACVRLADCYLIQRRFDDALTNYEKAYAIIGPNKSYALFQGAIVKGITRDYQGKIKDLSTFMNTYRNDPLFIEAIYETAFTYELIDDYKNAIFHYQNIIQNYKNAPQRVRALKKLGLLYYKLDRNNEALTLLQKIVEEFPGTDEAREVMFVIRNIYTEQGDPDGFVSFMQRLGTSLSIPEQDSISYRSAENLFFRGDCSAAIQAFERYIKNFPYGAFLLNAYFYKAECEYSFKRYEQALQSYKYVIEREWNKFSERALINVSQMYYLNKNYERAAEYYGLLEQKASSRDNILLARIGLMRSYFHAKLYRMAINAAEKVIQHESKEHSNEAYAILGVSYYETEEFAESQRYWQELIKLNNEYAAQAYYYLALINYRLNRPAEAERLIFELLSKLPSYEYWIARSFLVLADIYTDKGDYYQAKHALQGVIDNYHGIEVVNEAKQKLQKIQQLQNKQ